METSRRCTVRNLSLGQTSRGPERVRAKERKHVMAMIKEIREDIPRDCKIDINVSNSTSMIKRRSNEYPSFLETTHFNHDWLLLTERVVNFNFSFSLVHFVQIPL